ncbi:MAG: hypothetical protein EOP84_12110 [Verrucomicrobiaceae bacterium]|nr:MAG: hypothetical protein EOP84_12110 [Verrucomicrobiaceae bacterium]
MLLRRGKSAVDKTRVDLLFQDVVWMAILAWFDSLELSLCESQVVTQSLGQKIRDEARFRNCYCLRSEDAAYFVIAGGVSTAEDECEYFQPSALIPDLQITHTFPS